MDDNNHAKLTEEQKHILHEKGTEPPFSGKYLEHDEQGVYSCANCGAELFKSEDKYHSNVPGLLGWPSFAEASKLESIKLIPDDSYGMSRTEAVCANCGGHLGHLFDDESSPSGKHYCVNSLSLDFKNNSSSAGAKN